MKWVNAFKAFGDEGLMRSRKNETYTFEFKLHVVELYLSTEVSYQELALSIGINNPPLITKWVNDFRIAGPDALRPKRKGRRSKVSKPKESKLTNIEHVSNHSEYLKQLEDENLKLRIENAYLKELRRLRLEEETLLKKQRESSTASEETSN
jgi:transposase